MIDLENSKVNLLTYEYLLGHLPGYIYWKNCTGIFLGCNVEQATALGFKVPRDIVGKSIYKFCNKREANNIAQNDKLVIEKGVEVEVVERINNQHFLSKKKPLKDGNKVIGILGISVNITKQKKLERKLQKQAQKQTMLLDEALETRERFLNNIRHEITTPLHGAFGIAEELYLKWEELSEQERKLCVKNIYDSKKRLKNLILALLDVSVLKNVKTKLKFKLHDMKFLIHDVINEFRDVLYNVSFKVYPIDTCIHCDGDRLKQVIRNVASNAVKYGGGSRALHISIKRITVRRIKQLKISIADKGQGVLENELSLIFEPFYESSRTRKKSGGTGLGLSICSEIIKSHRGKIWAESNKPRGTIIHFTIPCKFYDRNSKGSCVFHK